MYSTVCIEQLKMKKKEKHEVPSEKSDNMPLQKLDFHSVKINNIDIIY